MDTFQSLIPGEFLREEYTPSDPPIKYRLSTCTYQGNPHYIKELTFSGPLEYIDIANEVEIQRSLSDLNVCGIVDFRSDERTWAVMLLGPVDGDLMRDIEMRRDNGNHWTDEELMNHFSRLINTFEEAQKRGKSHRNIKPQNIYRRKGQLLATGFDCAKKMVGNTTSTVKGCPFYLSPELRKAYIQISSGKPTAVTYDPFRSDVYSLGLTFLCMCELRELDEMTRLNTLEE